ncbi:MAG TPA: M48 family metalloprotease [Alphaproteobacteria bacterium]|nr:M48 family metalloprotease [Alphaproteobacteria bacterium]
MVSPLRRMLVAFVAATLLVAGTLPALAQRERASLVRDAEIENTIRAYATPLLEAAGLDPAAVHIYLIEANSINAFVAGGQNIFLHTGLLTNARDPAAVIGVLAHEIGHIAGGHLARMPEALENATIQSLIAILLGVGAVASGVPDVGTVILQGGTALATQNIISFTVQQEQSADQAGLSYLTRTHQSAEGLLALLETLEQQELLASERQNPYILTHPLTRDRLAHVRDYVANSPDTGRPPSPEFAAIFARMQAKLMGFLSAPGTTLQHYATADTSVAARYARAIAYYRIPDLARALPEIDGLIAEFPDDPYFHELKGQMLFENGRIAEAIPPYERAVDLRPDIGLFRLGLAQAMIETGDPALNEDALVQLRAALVNEEANSLIWRSIGIAEGRKGNIGVSSLALAEEALLQGRLDDLRFHMQRAEQHLAQDTPEWAQLEALKREADDLEERLRG